MTENTLLVSAFESAKWQENNTVKIQVYNSTDINKFFDNKGD